jgi:hypothetical protein
MSNPTGIRKDKNLTATALLGVAAIQIVVGFLGWSVYRDSFGWLDWIIMFSGAIYIALSVAARWLRLPAALIGATFYAAFLAFQAFRGIDWLMSGLIFKVPVVILLLVSALQRSHPPGHPRCTP